MKFQRIGHMVDMSGLINGKPNERVREDIPVHLSLLYAMLVLEAALGAHDKGVSNLIV